MRVSTILLLAFSLSVSPPARGQNDNEQEHYTDGPMFQSRPDPTRERFFGVIGTTGLRPRVYPGVVLIVEEIVPGSPSDGKFSKGETLTGINGTALKGINPFVGIGGRKRVIRTARSVDGGRCVTF